MTPPEPRQPLREDLFRVLVESVTAYAIFLLDEDGCVRSWNPGAQRIKGYRADEIIGQHFSRFYPAEANRTGWPEYELKQAREEGRFEDEGWRLRKDGSRFWANVVITALRDDAGELLGFSKITRDLTERRQHEEDLRRSEERFRLVVETVVDYAIFMLDPNGVVLTWNAGAERINGYAAQEIIGRHFSRFYPGEAIASGWPEHELQQAAEHGRFEDEGWRLRKDGSRYWANVVITALRDQHGALHGFAKITRDLTERRRSQALEQAGLGREELLEAERSARMEAQRAVRIKDDFLATLSHELRTPLSAIMGWVQVLRRSRELKEEDLQRGTDAIERNARAQVQLIDELLDLNRIISGRLRLDVQAASLKDAAEAAIESMTPAADAKNLRIERTLDPNAGPVSGDPDRLQQIIWNLISNAVKFTSKGGRVQIVLQRVDSHVELSVSDTGIGIAPEFLPHVFDRFSQEDSSASRHHNGLGLGLAIAKQLAELHGGTLRAQSDGVGLGASFTLSLPISIAHRTRPPGHATTRLRSTLSDTSVLLPDLAGLRILVVDDEADGRALARRILEAQGATVTTAGSAIEALEFLEQSDTDVLISDIGMPGMDGYQLIRAVRASEWMKHRVPAIATTAFARAEDRKKAMLAGFHAHLAKPFDIAELVIIVANLSGRGV